MMITVILIAIYIFVGLVVSAFVAAASEELNFGTFLVFLFWPLAFVFLLWAAIVALFSKLMK